MSDQDELAGRFEQERPKLRAMAYRMLGSVSEADDAVQDAWLRLARTDAEAIDNLGGWLTTVTARVCLNLLSARASRREDSLDARVPDLVVEPVAEGDPERQAVLADSVGLALMIVLEVLTPAERVAFVLHDMFDLPFEQIAPLVERSTEATRQLASRARRRVRGAAIPEQKGDVADQRRVVDAFFAAAGAGDFDRLVAVLDPGVLLRVDAGPANPARSALMRGPAAVAAQALMFGRPSAGGVRPVGQVHPVLVGGVPGVVVTVGGRPISLMAFTVSGGRIVEIDSVVDADRLADLDAATFG